MTQFPRLSNREWDVLKLLLQGKGNKLIALSLDISVRTVEFHLKNIYAKFQVSSRIELILKLGNATGEFEIEKLRRSTVANIGENVENRDRLNLWMSWAKSFRETVSIIGKESEMKNLISKHIFASVIATLLTGLLWVAVLEYSGNLSVEDFKIFTIPLIIILAIGGLIVGVIGKQRGETLLKVLFSAVFGTGLSPFMIIPLMMFVVIPIGKLVAGFGGFDPSTIPAETASIIAMSIMITLWLVASTTLGIVLLILSVKLRLKNNNGQVAESA
ncbi:MAG: hypothetical protein DDG60_15135 [Anaerolineae bacterium]|nr:MAG: hypothetical protein DDG60_15135 [Anaerolineae bacterium]